MKKVLSLIACLFVVSMLVTMVSSRSFARQDEEDRSCDVVKVEKCKHCKDDGYLKPEEITEEGKCSMCNGAVELVDTCVKTGYLCEMCGKESFKAGDCAECATKMKELTVQSRVVYVCKGCGYYRYEPGKCDYDDQADCFGKDLKKSCENSGYFPHTKTK